MSADHPFGDAGRRIFARRLYLLDRWLTREGIPYAVIGGVAVAAHVDQGWSLDFDRPHSHHESQRIPDIDVLVPRDALARVQRFAAASVSSPYSVKVDTVAGECYIDWRPEDPTSYLTHRQLRFPLPSELFRPEPALLLGRQVKVLDPRTLLHTFGTVGGVIRRRDEPKERSLAEAIGSGAAVTRFSEADCDVFRQYIVARRNAYPMFVTSKQTWEALMDLLPTRATRAVEHRLSPWAQSMIGEWNSDPGGRRAQTERRPRWGCPPRDPSRGRGR